MKKILVTLVTPAITTSSYDLDGETAQEQLTCDQTSLYFRGGKVRLIHLLDYLSVASPESGLFSDWSRNKRYLELSH